MRVVLIAALAATVAVTEVGCAAPSTERRTAEQVVWRSLAAPDAAERRQAIRIVVEVADPALEPGVAPRLADSDPVVQAVAASSLAGEIPEARELLRRLLDSGEAEARVTALDGVAALADGAAQAARLTHDAAEEVRARAAWMLALSRAPQAAARLEELLADREAGVRAEALRALSSLDARRAAAHAEQALADPSLAVRLAGLASLARAGADRHRLLALTGGEDRFVALRAAVQLDRSGASSVEAAKVVADAAGDRHAVVRAAAMNAASQLGPRGRAICLQHLTDASVEVRLAAARGLLAAGGDGGGSSSAARRVLRAALGTPFRLDAADELARLGDAEGRRLLAAAARAPDAATRHAALGLLSALSPEPPELAVALGDSDASVRLGAARSILRRALRPYLR